MCITLTKNLCPQVLSPARSTAGTASDVPSGGASTASIDEHGARHLIPFLKSDSVSQQERVELVAKLHMPAQHQPWLPRAAADHVGRAHVALRHLVALSLMRDLCPAASADDRDGCAGLEAPFRYPAVQSSGAAAGFKLFAELNNDYVMDEEHFAGSASSRPVYKCVVACMFRVMVGPDLSAAECRASAVPVGHLMHQFDFAAKQTQHGNTRRALCNHRWHASISADHWRAHLHQPQPPERGMCCMLRAGHLRGRQAARTSRSR